MGRQNEQNWEGGDAERGGRSRMGRQEEQNRKAAAAEWGGSSSKIMALARISITTRSKRSLRLRSTRATRRLMSQMTENDCQILSAGYHCHQRGSRPLMELHVSFTDVYILR